MGKYTEKEYAELLNGNQPSTDIEIQLANTLLDLKNHNIEEHSDNVEDPLNDDFSKIASDVEDRWEMSGFTASIYESFARSCFNKYKNQLLKNLK